MLSKKPFYGNYNQDKKVAKVRSRYGVVDVPDLQNDIIGRSLQHYGEWAWLETEFIASLLPPAARVLDIGAFIGTFSLGLALRSSVSSIVAVEANTEIAPLLTENLCNNLTAPSIAINSIVVGDVSVARYKHSVQNNFGGTSYITDLVDQTDVITHVDVITLRQLREQHGPFDLIKCDVEGAELEIIRGDKELLKSLQGILWLECNESPQSLDLVDLLLSSGLSVTYFGFPAYNPDNFRKASSVIFPCAYEAGLVVTSSEVPSLPKSLSSVGCILKPIFSTEDLRQALWVTPRWGMTEWQGATAHEIVAMSTHTLRNDNFDTFLSPDWTPGEILWDKIKKLEDILSSERDKLSAAESALIQSEESVKRFDFDVELRLIESESINLDRLSELGRLTAEHQRLEAEHQRLEAEHQRLEAEHQRLEKLYHDKSINFDIITKSKTWKTAMLAHKVIKKIPYLKGLLKITINIGGRTMRYLKINYR